jgi:hypothetical protein
MRRAVHFVGFRDDRYYNAVAVFGPPDFVHMGWDKRAQREIAPDDTVVFANGDDTQPMRYTSYPDTTERT